MFNWLKWLVPLLLCDVAFCSENIAQPETRYNIGTPATEQVIAGWDIDVRPDGMGLPKGSGSVVDGEALYEDKCAMCHGSFGEGEGRWPKLSGGEGTLRDERPEKTVGSYWPYASTLWDYINRAMPFVAPQSLAPDEVYAITAYVLNLNEIVDDEFVLTQANLAAIEMPNKDGFYVDNRPDVVNQRCMNNCKDPKTIKLISTIKGVTPTDHFKNDGNDGIAFIQEHTVKVDPQVLQTYRSVCQTCHENGLAGAPKPSDHVQWQVRLKQGKEALYLNAINGFNAMPAKGGRVDLSDDLVKSIVDYMLKQAADTAEQ